jgi:hypothetical protein
MTIESHPKPGADAPTPDRRPAPGKAPEQGEPDATALEAFEEEGAGVAAKE